MNKFKLDHTGSCESCKNVPIEGDELICYLCKSVFHGTCGTSNEEKVGTKTMVNNFNKTSTKSNFLFLCDCCLTKFEADQVKTQNDRLDNLEKQLSEIKSLLKESRNPPALVSDPSPIPSKPDNIWFDPERLEKTKLPPVKPMLIMKKGDPAANASIEDMIIENKMPVTKAFTNTSGDLVLVCDSVDTRDKLKDITSKKNLELKTVVGKKENITIVGLSKKLTKEEVVERLVSQNQFLTQFCTVNDVNEHFTVHDIKSIKANENVFQIFASVSGKLREGLRNFKDKVTIGITVCKIYDRVFVKRCNNCQGLGHYYKDCKSPNTPTCANCSGAHRTDACSSTVKKCINCSFKGLTPCDHTAYDSRCPTLIAFSNQPNLN